MYVTGFNRAWHCDQILFTGNYCQYLSKLVTEILVPVIKFENGWPGWAQGFWGHLAPVFSDLVTSFCKYFSEKNEKSVVSEKNLVPLATPVIET